MITEEKQILMRYKVVQIGRLVIFKILEQHDRLTSKSSYPSIHYYYDSEESDLNVHVYSACQPALSFEGKNELRICLRGDCPSTDENVSDLLCDNEEEAIKVEIEMHIALYKYCKDKYETADGKSILLNIGTGEIYI